MKLLGRSAKCYLLWATLFVASNSHAQKSPDQEQTPIQETTSKAPATELSSTAERTCRTFVQKFYDWYWNQFAKQADNPRFDLRKLHDYHEVVNLKPPVLSPTLIMLIRRDEQAAAAAGGIANLDFDPFLNSQDPQGRFMVDQAKLSKRKCRVTIPHGHMTIDLENSGRSWVFVNFFYSFYSDDGKTKQAPDSDLIQILKQ